MKKLLNILVLSSLVFSIFATINVNCMHRKMFKKSYKQQNHMSKKRGPKKVWPKVKKRVIARNAKNVAKQQEESFYREAKPKISLAEFRRLKNGANTSGASEDLPYYTSQFGHLRFDRNPMLALFILLSLFVPVVPKMQNSILHCHSLVKVLVK